MMKNQKEPADADDSEAVVTFLARVARVLGLGLGLVRVLGF